MTCTYAVYKGPNSNKRITTHTESEGIEKNVPSKWTWKKKKNSWGATLTSDTIDFKTKST